MKIVLDLNKSVEENASLYFEKAKKAKKKMEGAKVALQKSKKKLEKIKIVKKEIKEVIKRKLEWFEKFRWFYTSNGFLVIAGRDATTNEIIIKKHTTQYDLVFHTDITGSPFAVIQTEKKTPTDLDKSETAQFCACFSRAWKLGLGSLAAWYVNPDQVTKTAPSGEYIQKGSFMIYGKKNIIEIQLELYIGMRENGLIMSGPRSAVSKHCKQFVKIVQGKDKTSVTAKKIQKAIGGELDDIIKALPSGGCEIQN